MAMDSFDLFAALDLSVLDPGRVQVISVLLAVPLH
jgi:hypothetical protein